MNVLRAVLLAGSESTWLREQLTRRPFFRRSVSRFMPGERLEDALRATMELRAHGIGTLVTQLGENVTTTTESADVGAHYLDALQQIADGRHDALVSVKLTQLGLDLGVDGCLDHVLRVARRAGPDRMVWIDMEASRYVDATLEVFRRARSELPNIGLCLQAYLYRTAADLEALLPLGPAIRLVKGAYREPKDIAYARKRDVDDNFERLAARLLDPAAQRAGAFAGLATHDGALIERLTRLVSDTAAARFDFEMLFGIQVPLQRRLVKQGLPLRVLISYGPSWFPWYMRRLAERPANVWFVARNLFSS